MRGSLSERRFQIVEKTWKTLDRLNLGQVNIRDLKACFNAAGHPDVVEGRSSAI